MNTPHTDPINFHEKSAWAVLISTVVIYGAYFVAVFAMPAAEVGAPITLFFLLVGAVVAQIIALTVSHILFAVREAPEAEDERDRLIDLKSDRVGAWVLAAGAMLIVLALIAGGTIGAASDSSWNIPGPFIMGNLLLLVFVLSEIVKRVSQVVHYRKGV